MHDTTPFTVTTAAGISGDTKIPGETSTYSTSDGLTRKLAVRYKLPTLRPGTVGWLAETTGSTIAWGRALLLPGPEGSSDQTTLSLRRATTAATPGCSSTQAGEASWHAVRADLLGSQQTCH